MKLYILHFFFIFLVYKVEEINTDSNFKVIEVFTPGVSVPEHLYTIEAFDTAEKVFALNNRKENSQANININLNSFKTQDEETAYDILGNKWTIKDSLLLTEKGLMQGSFSGKILKEFYSELLKLPTQFTYEDYSLFTPYCYKDNYIDNNDFKVSKEPNSKINTKNLIKLKNYNENCNKRYQQAIYSKLLGFYPDLSFNKFLDNEIDNKFFSNLNINIRNKKEILSEINKSIKEDDKQNTLNAVTLPIRAISNKSYASASLRRYNNCTTATKVYDDAVIKENLNDLAKEFDKKYKNILKKSLINLHNMIQTYFSSLESSFSSIVELCESLIISIESQNFSGLKSDIFTKDIQKEIFLECKNIFKKHYFHAMLIDKHQIQLLVRDFYEDLVNVIDQEMISNNKDYYSYTFDTISSFKSEHSKEDISSTSTSASASSSTQARYSGLNKDDVITNKDKSNLHNTQQAFYNKLNMNFLKKYTMVVQEPLFQAAAMSFLKEVFGSKNYLPSLGSSLIFELKFESNVKVITVYYNNNNLLQESFFNFSKKTKEYLISENDILIWCGLQPNMNKIYDITMYASFSLFLLLGGVIVFMYFCGSEDADNLDKQESQRLVDNEKDSSADLGGSDRPILTEEDQNDNEKEKEKETKLRNNNENDL